MSAGWRERKVLEIVKPFGYDGARSAGSRGLWDLALWRVRPLRGDEPTHACASLVLIQVKSENDKLTRQEWRQLARYRIECDGLEVSKQVWTFPVHRPGQLPRIEFIPDRTGRIAAVPKTLARSGPQVIERAGPTGDESGVPKTHDF